MHRFLLFFSQSYLNAKAVTFCFQELDHVVEELEKIAVVNLLQHRSIISLIGNVQKSSLILEKVLCGAFLIIEKLLSEVEYSLSFHVSQLTANVAQI